MSSYSSQLEHLIDELGGCGLLQKLLCAIVHISSTVTVWSMLAMSFIGYDSDFTCHTLDVKLTTLSTLNLSELSTYRLCSVGQNATCSSYRFLNSMDTVVSEWNLVCDRQWIVAFITSIQMVGVLLGSIIAGQMADSTGRKPTMLTGFTTMVVFNFVGYFMQSWQTYCAVRFFIGIGVGICFTVQFPLMIEFVPPLWRPLVVCIPAEPLIYILYAIVAWWLHDWKRIHLLKTLIGIFFLMILCLVPESFRWLVSKMKFEQADRSIDFVANVNSVPKPNLKKIFDSAETEINTPSNTTAVYTVATLLTTEILRNITLTLSTLWFSVSTAWYSMSLGMESISVNIYLTIFLINLVDIPVHLVTGPLLNRFGRKKSCLVAYCLSSILSCVSGILQHFDQIPGSSMSLTIATLVISLLAKMAVSTSYLAITIYTTELYPTVVRTIGYGFQSTVGRIGAVAAPLLIHLDKLFPGLMYFTCGVLIFMSAGTITRLKETKDVTLPDSILNSSKEPESF